MENEIYDKDDEVALNQAIVRGDMQKVRELILAGFDVNNRAPDGTMARFIHRAGRRFTQPLSGIK